MLHNDGMSDWNPIARLLVFGGAALIVAGLLAQFGPRVFPWLGRLPGDITVKSENVTVYAPIVTMIVVSIVLTVLVNVVLRIFNGGGGKP